MARIVLATWGSYGDLNPFIGLAAALAARGHAPVIAAPEFYRRDVEAEGIAFRPMRPDVDPTDRALIARIMDARRGTEFMVRELLVPAVRGAYDDLWAATEGADLLVSHPVTFAAPLVGERRGMRWLSAVLAPISFFSRHDIPAFPSMPWTARLSGVPGAGRLLTGVARAITRRATAPVARLRAELGLPRAANPLFDGQFAPHGTLALFSRLLADPQPDWPARVTRTGFVFYDRTAGRGLPAGLDEWLGGGPPPLVFTLGSAAAGTDEGARRFFAASAAAARELGMRALLVAGFDGAARAAEFAGGGVHVTDAVPYSSVFPRAAAVVHQGGIGTTAQALAAGVPQLVVPFAHDQPDNAVRVARLGVARWTTPRRYAGGAAARELRLLLARPERAALAASIGAEVRSEQGAERACAAIEQTLDMVNHPNARKYA